jgi:hypothetical protein
VEDTAILRPLYFYEMLKNKRDAKRQLNTDFTLLSVERAGADDSTLSSRVSGSLREADYIGMDEEGKLFIILSNSNQQEAAIVVERLKRMGISAWIISDKDKQYLSFKDGVYV